MLFDGQSASSRSPSPQRKKRCCNLVKPARAIGAVIIWLYALMVIALIGYLLAHGFHNLTVLHRIR